MDSSCIDISILLGATPARCTMGKACLHSPGAKPWFLRRFLRSATLPPRESMLDSTFAVVLGPILHHLDAYITPRLSNPRYRNRRRSQSRCLSRTNVMTCWYGKKAMPSGARNAAVSRVILVQAAMRKKMAIQGATGEFWSAGRRNSWHWHGRSSGR